MRKIVLTAYEVGEGRTFDVRSSLVSILFNEEKLDGREVIRRDELATKIEKHPDESILLEDVEWNKLVTGLGASDLKPHGRSVVEFIKRVLDAPDVAVQEKS
jgi:hypothetical protein